MIDNEYKQELIQKVNTMLKSSGENHTLLYLSLYGSHLYGTHTSSSDLDLRGVFLPSYESLLLGEIPKEFRFSTGSNSSQNGADDIDINIFSLHKFIKLIREGDTNGLDLYFGQYNKDCVLFKHPEFETLLSSVSSILDIKDSKAYIGYSIGQAKRWGIKGSNYGTIKAIKNILDDHIKVINTDKFILADVVEQILRECGHKSNCFVKDIKDVSYLIVIGSAHQLNITLEEFKNRINKAYNQFSSRIVKAGENDIDYKALSHAVRVLDQCAELYETGYITFPLVNVQLISDIKAGKMDYEAIEEIILKGLDKAESLRASCDIAYKYNKLFVANELKRLYTVLG